MELQPGCSVFLVSVPREVYDLPDFLVQGRSEDCVRFQFKEYIRECETAPLLEAYATANGKTVDQCIKIEHLTFSVYGVRPLGVLHQC